MKLYHGTNYSSALAIVMNGIDLTKSQKYLDFGPGFYTTPNYDHAAITAIRKTSKYNMYNKKNEEPYVVEMKVNFGNQSQFQIWQASRYNEKWGRFVLNNRLTREILEEYNITEHNQDGKHDICYGEIADGSIINIAYKVNNKEIEISDVNCCKFFKENKVYGLQYSFHSVKALSCISDLKCGIIINKNKYNHVAEGR